MGRRPNLESPIVHIRLATGMKEALQRPAKTFGGMTNVLAAAALAFCRMNVEDQARVIEDYGRYVEDPGTGVLHKTLSRDKRKAMVG